MAQTGYTPILIYSSSTAAAAPAVGNLTNSTLGSELAINITDGKLFYKDNANAIQVIGWKTVPTSAGGTGLTSYTAGDLLYYASGTTLTKLGIGAANTVLTSSGSAPQWSTNLNIGSLTATSISDSGNLTFTGTGNRITGDFSNATFANRTMFQNSVTNANSQLGLLPNGTGTASNFAAHNASDPTNASRARMQVNSTVVSLESDITGTGTYLPMAFYTNNIERARIFTSGGVSIGNTTDPGATNLSVTGRTVSALFRTDSGQIVPASGVTTTIFTCPTLDNGCYIVTCNIPGQAPPTYSAVGLVRVGGTTLSFTSLAGATTLTISVSGQNIRVVQNSGGTNAVDWTVIRIS